MTYTEQLIQAAGISLAAFKKALKETVMRIKDCTGLETPPLSERVFFANGKRGNVQLKYTVYGRYKVAFVEDWNRGTIAVVTNA